MPSTTQDGAIAHALAEAIRFQRSGDHRAAERLRCRLLALDGINIGAWLRPGGLALQDGRHGLFARCFARVIPARGSGDSLGGIPKAGNP
ncbi:hypothetical protein [Azospirillum argentinense]